jgi:hypothetical protein
MGLYNLDYFSAASNIQNTFDKTTRLIAYKYMTQHKITEFYKRSSAFFPI